MAERSPPIVQLVDVVSAGVTPAFKKAVQRGAAKRGIGIAEYLRGALSDCLSADGVVHRHPRSRRKGGAA